MRITAATAWKEKLPFLSEESKKLLNIKIKPIAETMGNRFPTVEIIPTDKVDTGYGNNKIMMNHYVNIGKVSKAGERNRGVSDVDSTIHDDILFHEYMEKNYENKRNKPYYRVTRHNNPGVVIQETKRLLQTGGNTTRPLANTLDVREQDSKFISNIYGRVANKQQNKNIDRQRIRNNDWNWLIKKANKVQDMDNLVQETKDSVTIKREKEARQSSLKSKLGWGRKRD